MEPPQGRAEIEKLFGNPSMINGKLNEEWARANIMLVPTPNNWQLYYQNSGKLTKIPGIRMHKLLKDLFLKSLNEIWNYAKQEIGDSPSDDTIRNWLHNLRVDQTNGGFEFRAITGGTQLSLHSYGIAIDWDADHNPRKKPLSKTLPDWWYNIWSTNGWSNGCHFPTPDPMHIQYATNAFMFDEYEAIFNKKNMAIVDNKYVPLSWEKNHPERMVWSEFILKAIESLYDNSFSFCEDINTFRNDYSTLNKNQKINIWGELISALCKFESNWSPVSRMKEDLGIDPVTNKQVVSEGLMQLSYQDKVNYNGKVPIECKFNWQIDKPLYEINPKDPNITILNPYYNLEYGIHILAYQVRQFKKLVIKKYAYWSIIKEGSRYQKINEIKAMVEAINFSNHS